MNDRIQDYLTSDKITTEEKQLLFQLRTRTFNCKANYSNLYNSELACSLCQEEDNQQHLLHCDSTTVGVDLEGVQYNHIFGRVEQQVIVIKIMKKITTKRTILLKSSKLGSQVHPC